MSSEPEQSTPPRLSRFLIVINIVLPLLIVFAIVVLVYGLFFRNTNEAVVVTYNDCKPEIHRDSEGIHIHVPQGCGPLHLTTD